ncbi:geranylgeranylglycerol-phosphate geranylgeranyltransferase [Candidatus Cloacimonadota bacterium]
MPYFLILRPINFFSVLITVLFGALFRNKIPFNLNILFAMISASLISGAGYVINDFFDLKIDVVNRPNRVIPSGRISPKAAYLYSVFLFVLGIITSYLTANIYCVIMAIINSLLLFLYARYYKKTLLAGNLIVSYSAFSCFIYGGLTAGNLKNSFILGLFAFLFTFIREIVKDAEDIEGDRQFGVRSLAIYAGKKVVIWTSSFFVLLITILFLYLYKIQFFSITILLLSFLLITVPLTFIMRFLYANIDSKQAFSRSSTLLKVDMLVFLVIVIIGS